MKKLYIVLISVSLFSCEKQDQIYPTPCDGNCGTSYEVIYKGQPIQQNPNGFYEIQWDGLNYFQIKGDLTPLNDQYVINDVPLIQANFDSDYWIVVDSIRFQTPMFSYLGWFNNQSLNTPISFASYTYTMTDLISLHPPTNIAGYQIPQHLCLDCPSSSTLLGTHSKYTYTPTQNIILDNEMIGDTLNIFVETIFNTDIGEKEVVENHIKIIII